jgi:hypothetical protein
MSIIVKPFFVREDTLEEIPYAEENGSEECSLMIKLLQEHLGNVLVGPRATGNFNVYVEATEDNINTINNIHERNPEVMYWPELGGADYYVRYEIVGLIAGPVPDWVSRVQC